jgi:hypothetical protein
MISVRSVICSNLTELAVQRGVYNSTTKGHVAHGNATLVRTGYRVYRIFSNLIRTLFTVSEG